MDELLKNGVSFYQMFVGITPVLVGGSLALSGSFLTYIWNKKTKQRELKLQKLEQLMIACIKVKVWLNDYSMAVIDGSPLPPKDNPLDEISYLAAIHFKELGEQVDDFTIAAMRCCKLLAKMNSERSEDGKLHEEFSERFISTYSDVVDANSKLLTKAGKLAKSL